MTKLNEYSGPERRKWPCGHCGDHADKVRDISDISSWIDEHKKFAKEFEGEIKVAIEQRLTIGQFKYMMAGIGSLLILILGQLFMMSNSMSEVKTDVKVSISTNKQAITLLQSQITHIGGIQQSVIRHLPIKEPHYEIQKGLQNPNH